MTSKTLNFKTTAIALAASLLSSTALPVTSVQAHERHNAGVHYGHGSKLNRKNHRKFHNRFGRGYNGTKNYRQHAYRNHSHKKRRKNSKGDLIAAGVIGLAIGAIIASEGAKKRHYSGTPNYRGNPPAPSNSGTYGYQDPYYNNAQQHYSSSGRPIPLNQYNEPEVITFNDPADLQPWTPGWREWCSNRYRSFNARTGTFRGYDGLDHFCVPK